MQDTEGGTLRPAAEPARTPEPARTLKPTKSKATGREQRLRRRKRRKRFEELLAWIVVPVILFGIYWGVMATFDFFGTDPGTVWDQLKQVKQMLEKKI